MSKGSRPRPYSISQKDFGNNYDAIFRKPDPRIAEDQKNEDEAFKEIEKNSQVKTPDTPPGWTRHADGRVSPPPGTTFTAQSS
jgi:hypothetical protein